MVSGHNSVQNGNQKNSIRRSVLFFNGEQHPELHYRLQLLSLEELPSEPQSFRINLAAKSRGKDYYLSGEKASLAAGVDFENEVKGQKTLNDGDSTERGLS